MNTNGKHSTNPVTPAAVASAEEMQATEGPLATGERFRPIALAGLTVLLLALCVWLAMPFLTSLAWAVALAIISWPLHMWIRRHIRQPGRAAVATTLIVLLAIVVPGLLISYQLVREASSATERMKTDQVDNTLRGRMKEEPALQGVVAWMDRVNLDVDGEVRSIVGSYTSGATGLLQGSVMAIILFALTLFILFHFLKDAPMLRHRVRSLLPMTVAECNRVFASVSDSVRANLYATVVTSLINGVTGGLLFWMLGLPSPVLWGVVLFVVSIIPVLGTFLIWVPAAAYLALTNQWGGAIVLVSWGVLSAVFVDSIFYVRVAGNRMRLHQVPVLLAFLGGLAMFGPSGVVLGPAILAVTVAVLDVWHCRAEAADVLQNGDGESPSAQPTAQACAIPTSNGARADNVTRQKVKA